MDRNKLIRFLIIFVLITIGYNLVFIPLAKTIFTMIAILIVYLFYRKEIEKLFKHLFGEIKKDVDRWRFG